MNIIIRQCVQEDIFNLTNFAKLSNHSIEPLYFETAFEEQLHDKRIIFLAFLDKELAGYIHLNFNPQYIPFKRFNIPEIQDLFVHPDLRQRGIGGQLILTCEAEAKNRCGSDIGIGVGVTAQFGPAQKLYIKMGYSPDGAGAVFDRSQIQSGDIRPIDERVCFMLVKSLA